MKQHKPIPEEIKEYLSYVKVTGELTWIKKPANQVKIGSSAGTIDVSKETGKKYKRLRFKGNSYRVHRVIWFLVTNEQPQDEIDHHDGDGLNNRWDNLREATRMQNTRNTPLRVTNTVGFKGVSKNGSKFRVRICDGTKQITVGNFNTPEEAHRSYRNAAKELHRDFANFG